MPRIQPSPTSHCITDHSDHGCPPHCQASQNVPSCPDDVLDRDRESQLIADGHDTLQALVDNASGQRDNQIMTGPRHYGATDPSDNHRQE